MLEVLLFLLEAALDDLRAREEPLLEVPEGLVLDHDGGLLVEVLAREAQLLQNGGEVVLLLFILSLLFVLLLALLHLIARLVVDRLL